MGHDYFDGEHRGQVFGVKSAVDELHKDPKFLDDFDGKGMNFRSWYFVK